MVWRNKYGRIPFGWVVHHINKVKTDNSIENLVALPTWKHDQVHADMRAGKVFTADELLGLYHTLKTLHDQYKLEMNQAVARIKEVRAKFNEIGVNNVALDKYLTKIGSKPEQVRQSKKGSARSWAKKAKPIVKTGEDYYAKIWGIKPL
jgi:hypothetical protein